MADSPNVSSSRAPETPSLNYSSLPTAVTGNDRRPQIHPNESPSPPSVLSPTHILYMSPLSSSGSGSNLIGSHSSQTPNYMQSPWFDGPDYQVLYKEISHQAFEGYGSLETDMVRPNYRIPNRSIRSVSEYMEEQMHTAVQHEEQDLDSKYGVGFNKSELHVVSQRQEGLTLGEAIQKLYMSRLRQSNTLLPMTKVYEGGWDTRVGVRVPDKQHPTKAGTVWLGDVVDSVNIELLRANHITAMVSVHPRDFRSVDQAKHGRNSEEGLRSPIRWHLQIQLADSKEADMESELDKVSEFIQSHVVDRGHNLLVHCIAGLSRSVAVVRDFIQRMEVKRGRIDMTGTPAERYARMKTSREATFQRLKTIRPGITEDNFKQQLDNSTRKICGLARQPKAVAGSAQKSKEHGGGGYMGDSVALVFFYYRLRPTPRVIELFEQRQRDHARKEEALGQVRNGFSFPAPLIQWFEDCIQYLASAP